MKVAIVENENQLQDAYSVRKKVFVVEQHVPPEIEIDDLENEATHFVVYDENESPVGAGRFRVVEDYGKVERVCILQSFRGHGVGREIMNKIEEFALDQNIHLIKLNAQTHAEPFYLSLGYTTYSDEFFEAGIPHVSMKKEL